MNKLFGIISCLVLSNKTSFELNWIESNDCVLTTPVTPMTHLLWGDWRRRSVVLASHPVHWLLGSCHQPLTLQPQPPLLETKYITHKIRQKNKLLYTNCIGLTRPTLKLPPTLEVFFFHCAIFVRNCAIVIRNHKKSSWSNLKKILYGLNFNVSSMCFYFCLYFLCFMNIYTGYVCINGHTAG